MTDMTDEAEAVARAISGAPFPSNASLRKAQAAITALDKHRIERAGELEIRLRARAWLTDLQANQDAFLEAAATIASLRAEIERAKLDGVRAGIEASAGAAELQTDYTTVTPFVHRGRLLGQIRALSAEAIAKGE